MENLKVDPRPGSDSTQMRPPCLSTIVLQIAKPTPVPARELPCRRLNTPKTYSLYSAGIPMPLSHTLSTHSSPFCSAVMRITGASSLLYLMALLIDRKSTRLNSSHLGISYAVFCLKK